MVEEPLPVIEVGEKPMVTPDGWPDAVRLTAASKPPVTVLVIELLPALPAATVSELGEADSVKPAAGGPVSAVMSAACGLPQPVTRS